jgi:hypothetical protein
MDKMMLYDKDIFPKLKVELLKAAEKADADR